MAQIVFKNELSTDPQDQPFVQEFEAYCNRPDVNATMERIADTMEKLGTMEGMKQFGFFAIGIMDFKYPADGDGNPHNLGTCIAAMAYKARLHRELFDEQDYEALQVIGDTVEKMARRACQQGEVGIAIIHSLGRVREEVLSKHIIARSPAQQELIDALYALFDRHADFLQEVAAPFVPKTYSTDPVTHEEQMIDSMAYNFEKAKGKGLASVKESPDPADMVKAVRYLCAHPTAKVSQQTKLSLQPILAEIRKTVEDAVKANNTSEDVKQYAGEILSLLPPVTLSKTR